LFLRSYCFLSPSFGETRVADFCVFYSGNLFAVMYEAIECPRQRDGVCWDIFPRSRIEDVIRRFDSCLGAYSYYILCSTCSYYSFLSFGHTQGWTLF
jgi:hypothetical protein